MIKGEFALRRKFMHHLLLILVLLALPASAAETDCKAGPPV